MEKFNDVLIKMELLLCEVLIVVLVAVVFLNAVLRLFDSPINWSNDVAQLIFIWISFIGADLALKKDRHSGVDVIVKKFPAKVNKVLEIVTYLLIIVFLAVIGRAAGNLAVTNIARKFNSLPLSYSSVTFAVPVGCVLLGFTCVMKLITIISGREDLYKNKLNDPEPEEEDELV